MALMRICESPLHPLNQAGLRRVVTSLLVSLKWKPASENSIDFKLELRFPPSPHDANVPDFTVKPAFLLHTWLGANAHEFFDSMDITEETWEQ